MNNLEDLRKQIDAIDDQLLQLLQKRIAVMKQVGEAKKEQQSPIRDYERESQKLADMEQKATKLAIPAVLINNIWKLFFEISEEVEL